MDEALMHTIDRRRRELLVASVHAAVCASIGVVPFAAAEPADAAAAIRTLIGDRQARTGSIDLELPAIAENGNTVPVAVTVESPMSDTDHVTAIHLYAENNPAPEVVSFYFTPASGKAYAATRMRLAKTQNVVAIAETSDRSVLRVAREVKVTIGGCGG